MRPCINWQQYTELTNSIRTLLDEHGYTAWKDPWQVFRHCRWHSAWTAYVPQAQKRQTPEGYGGSRRRIRLLAMYQRESPFF
jgi:fatty acid desaturase